MKSVILLEMAISISIPFLDYVDKIIRKIKSKKEQEEVEILYSSIWKIYYETIRLLHQICEIEGRRDIIIGKKLDKNMLKSTLTEILQFFPLTNIEEIPYSKYSNQINYITIANRRTVDMLNRLSLMIKDSQNINLVYMFVSQLKFLSAENLLSMIEGIFDSANQTTNAIFKGLDKKTLDERKAYIGDTMNNTRQYVEDVRKHMKAYSDLELETKKYLRSINYF